MTPKADRPSRATCIKYALLQLPSLLLTAMVLLLLDSWLSLPAWLFWAILGLWVLKDLALFPFLWRAYQVETVTTGHPPPGTAGIAREPLRPQGLVEVGGELWQAESVATDLEISPGTRVRVVSARDLLLIVEPCPDHEATDPASPTPSDTD